MSFPKLSNTGVSLLSLVWVALAVGVTGFSSSKSSSSLNTEPMRTSVRSTTFSRTKSYETPCANKLSNTTPVPFLRIDSSRCSVSAIFSFKERASRCTNLRIRSASSDNANDTLGVIISNRISFSIDCFTSFKSTSNDCNKVTALDSLIRNMLKTKCSGVISRFPKRSASSRLKVSTCFN